MLYELKDFIHTFREIKSTPQNKWNENIFQELKIYINQLMIEAILSSKIENKGPKPKPETINKFLDALFELCDNGSKFSYLIKHHHISSSTFYRLFKVLINHKLLQHLHQNLLKGAIIDETNLLDSSHIRSLAGSEGVDYGFKEKGKKAIKLTILTSTDKIIYSHSLDPDNVADTVAFKKQSSLNQAESMRIVFADKGYHGEEFKKECLKNGYNVITPPKNYKRKRLRKNNKTIPEAHQKNLRKHRCKVEHVFAQLKVNSGLQIKRMRKIDHFDCLINLVILITSIHNGIIRGGLKTKTLLKIRRKE